ncbi:hypothetical protein CH368_16875 [Leptospira levettii]|nr:hypothetical protein CH368_16875 [Leptospira levettii]
MQQKSDQFGKDIKRAEVKLTSNPKDPYFATSESRENCEVLTHGFRTVRFFKSSVSPELVNIINNHRVLKSSHIDKLIESIEFTDKDFDYLIVTLVTSKDNVAQDIAIGLLARFPKKYFEIIVSLIKGQTYDYYGSLYLIEVIENWNAIDKKDRIEALESLCRDRHYSLLWPSILKTISIISEE